MCSKMITVRVLAWALLLGMPGAPWVCAAENEEPARPLQVGDPAPPLQQGRYVQGEPVAAFEAGKVYVVEFWSTWCGPCRTAIPHLNQLHEKYKDQGLVVIGQNGWERGADIEATVIAFVTGMGSNMTYRVALDDGEGQDGKMAATWWKAAGLKSIPASIVVDQAGRIAWIGHPMRGLDEAVEKVLAGTPGIGHQTGESVQPAQSTNATESGIEQRPNYAERRKQRMRERQQEAAPPSEPLYTGEELEELLQQHQMQLIREGRPPLPGVALTPESEAQLEKEGVVVPPFVQTMKTGTVVRARPSAD